jgi:hypothetical protein
MENFKMINGSWKSPKEIAKEKVENLIDLRMNNYDSYEDYASLYTDGVKDGINYVINIIKEKLDHFRYPEVGEMTDEFDELIMKLEEDNNIEG